MEPFKMMVIGSDGSSNDQIVTFLQNQAGDAGKVVWKTRLPTREEAQGCDIIGVLEWLPPEDREELAGVHAVKDRGGFVVAFHRGTIPAELVDVRVFDNIDGGVGAPPRMNIQEILRRQILRRINGDIRSLALKSAELSVDVDGDDPESIADTVRRHWRRGALYFNLPILGFSEDPEDEDTIRECGCGPLRPMPEEIGAALREYFNRGFHTPGRHGFNPEVEWEGKDWMLIDILPTAIANNHDRIEWAIFVPAAHQ